MRARRLYLDINQTVVAQRVPGTYTKLISRLERDEQDPAPYLHALAAALDVSVSWLEHGRGPQPGLLSLYDPQRLTPRSTPRRPRSRTPEERSPLGARCLQRRQDLELSQEEVARRARTNTAQYQKIEQGLSHKPRNLDAIAAALETTECWLMYGINEDDTPLTEQALALAQALDAMAPHERAAFSHTIHALLHAQNAVA